MLQMLKQIFVTGTVTERYAAEQGADGLRGEICLTEGGCIACDACIMACPGGALSRTAGSLRWEKKKCLFCGRCVELCQSKALVQGQCVKLAELSDLSVEGEKMRRKIMALLGRSLHIRHLDAGSCNACDFEMAALNVPLYDLQQYGIDFVASPRHADLLMVSGVVTQNLKQALLMTYEATPKPRLVMAVGACACSASVFPAVYAQAGAVDKFLPVDVYVPGCPPSPVALFHGLFLVMENFKRKN